MKSGETKKSGVNRVVRYFIFSDLFFVGGWGLINPIFAIFIVDEVSGATVATVGFAAAVYWILKAAFQIPIGFFLDKNEGEKDDFYTLVTGLVVASVTAFLFITIDKVWELLVLQAFHALGFALYTPAWNAIFTRHLDKNHYALDWSLDSTIAAFAAGFSGAIGGWIAATYGFHYIFIGASALTMIAAIIIFVLPDIVLPKAPANRVELPPKDHRPHLFGS